MAALFEAHVANLGNKGVDYVLRPGMVMAVDPAEADKCMAAVREAGETPYLLGEVRSGEKGVTLC